MDRIDGKKLKRYFNALPNFRTVDNGEKNYIYKYYNSDTKVKFSFQYYDELKSGNHNGKFTGLVFEVRCDKPHFYAIEAVAYVERACRELKMTIVPDEHSLFNETNSSCGDELYQEVRVMGNFKKESRSYSFDELYEIWRMLSEKFIESSKKNKKELYTISEKVSNDIWKYQREKYVIADILGDDYVVPNIFLMKRKDKNILYRTVTWKDCRAQIIPNCDYILLVQTRKKMFGGEEKKVSMIKYGELIKHMNRFLEDYNCKSEKTKILTTEMVEYGIYTFDLLEGEGLSNWKRVGIEEVVSVK
ncbi:hypothetical protein [Oceanirhabdus sp. W0125-5]|uniref:hypothetical protein n=1 Tax=Oceanirhabdus sp. W0125-5 TaxID=2999116 RepID=UPI0022F2B93A|nr:hypothetical protein [Oceanirhabdus sp. W0125-5]WBW96932.1 hypothetical protein OW730_25060 [Oceanirhabdus sp. W0125-5]